jgi:hypothetical protein
MVYPPVDRIIIDTPDDSVGWIYTNSHSFKPPLMAF